MELKENSEITLFVHDKGEEYFLHYESWNIIPNSYHVKKDEYLVDLVLKKELQRKDQNCQNGVYSYFGEF